MAGCGRPPCRHRRAGRYDELPATDVDGLAHAKTRGQRVLRHLGAVRAHRGRHADPGVSLRRVALECVEDLAADHVVYAEIRFGAQLTSPGMSSTRWSTRTAGFADGRRRHRRRPTDRGALSGDRDAPRRTLPVTSPGWRSGSRDKGVVGFDIAPGRGRESADPAPRRIRVHAKQQRALHDSCRGGVRVAVHPRGAGLLQGRPAGPRRAPRRRHRRSPMAVTGWAGWQTSCGTSGFHWRCARRRMYRPVPRGPSPSIRSTCWRGYGSG